ncbi:hypothetical protein HDU89_007739 [Geranomyces variabilis]|nr:hypothetical protein HDU89_007739 [Geranomyces variabilis]
MTSASSFLAARRAASMMPSALISTRMRAMSRALSSSSRLGFPDAARNSGKAEHTAGTTALPFVETLARPVSAPTLTGPPADIHAGHYGLFGTLAGSTITAKIARGDRPQHVYLNTAAPFCLVAVGLQGAGKSHTLATVMEACLYTAPPVTRADPPMLSLVFHYSEHGAEAAVCEAATLALGSGSTSDNAAAFNRKPVTVIVSPSFYAQRTQVYTNLLGSENCRVVPMLFRWHELTAAQIRGLLRVSVDGEMPLYMSVILDMLRKHQKRSHGSGMPSYKEFKAEINTLGLSVTQMEALMQRLRLIEMFLAEAEENAGLEYHPLPDLFDTSALVIADLTDPLLSGAEANGLFEILFSRFLRMDTARGKLVVCDEAHKYLSASSSSSTTGFASCSDPLTASLVSATQQMRHHGLRVVVSTQSPRVLPAALLEVVSIAVIHVFHAHDWFKHLQRKLPLADVWYTAIQRLGLGEAAVFSRKWDTEAFGDRGNVRTVQVRHRLSGDGGAGKILKD